MNVNIAAWVGNDYQRWWIGRPVLLGTSRPPLSVVYWFQRKGGQSRGQTGLFGRVKTSVGLSILVSVWERSVKGSDRFFWVRHDLAAVYWFQCGAGQSRGQTGLFGHVKTSVGLSNT